MAGLWEAISTAILRGKRPSASHSAMSASTAAVSPEITEAVGDDEIAATTSCRPASLATTSSNGRLTVAIAPLPSARHSRRERLLISRAPTSRVHAPDTTAAAISPIECPMTASGVAPWARHTSASAASIAKINI